MTRRLLSALLLATALAAPGAAAAQVFTRPFLEWRTVRTEHFEVHFPAAMSAWTLDVVSRLEAVHQEVSALVGYAPGRRVTVVVEDPSNQSNGFAFSFLDAPAIALWPTPPDPRSQIGSNRGFAEQLVVHEFAHVAHLTRPTRNPRQRLITRLLPVKIGPVSNRTPRWVREGYATWVEGKLTGSGRPHGVLRAAMLRQWALEGRLPTYEQLNATGGFLGGSMAYQAGSAFLEWLAARRGEESLVHLWRRLSARQPRAFAEAFAGVYGGSPQQLYGLFTVEVTARALEAREVLAEAGGVVEGDTVQRLAWGTGDPAVSPDGAHMAVVLRGAPPAPSRVVVWKTADEPREDSATLAARRRLLERDPEDVPAVQAVPRAKRPVATLFARGGRGHDQPRFLPGGDELLVVRQEPLGDGASVPDLFVWNWRRKSLRRVTRGAALRNPDPAPDGRSAAAVRCRGGVCDLVRVDLASGEVATLLAGTLQTVFYRPRWAPDGRSLVLAIQEEGRWRLGRVDAATGERRWIDPDDEASRYDAAFLPGGRALVAVSELGGVANLERIDLETGAARPLTRLTGAAAAPEPSPATGHVFYLSLHATGFDLNRVHPDSVALARVEALSPVLAPAAPRPRVPADTLERAPLPPVRAYGIGPRRQRLLPWGYHGADGGAFGLLLLSTDPVGRLAWTLRGSYGGDAQPRGGAAAAVWRGWRTAVAGEAFWVRHEPSREDGLLDDLALGPLDGDYAGAALTADRGWTTSFLRQRARAGVSLGALELAEGGSGDRRLAFVEYAATASTTVGARSLAAQAGVHGALGSTHGDGWRRGVATGSLAVRLGWLNARGAVTYGRTGAGAPPWERFQVGGSDGGLVDPSVLSQRIEMPAIPFGHLQGTEILALRASTTVRGLVPYFWAARAGEDADWFRVAGVETSVEMGANTLLRLPGVRLRLGAARVLDEPFEDELEVYASVTYRP